MPFCGILLFFTMRPVCFSGKLVMWQPLFFHLRTKRCLCCVIQWGWDFQHVRLLTITLVRNQKPIWSRSVHVHETLCKRAWYKICVVLLCHCVDLNVMTFFFRRERKKVIELFIFPISFPQHFAEMNINQHCGRMMTKMLLWHRGGEERECGTNILNMLIKGFYLKKRNDIKKRSDKIIPNNNNVSEYLWDVC